MTSYRELCSDLLAMDPKDRRATLRAMKKDHLADLLGEAKSQVSDAKTVEETIKDCVKRKGIVHAVGSLFQISVVLVKRTQLDTDKIFNKMGEAWCRRHSKLIEVKTVYCKAKS